MPSRRLWFHLISEGAIVKIMESFAAMIYENLDWLRQNGHVKWKSVALIPKCYPRMINILFDHCLMIAHKKDGSGFTTAPCSQGQGAYCFLRKKTQQIKIRIDSAPAWPWQA